MTPTHVYVIATGGCRVAIESSSKMDCHEAAMRGIERMLTLGQDLFGELLSVTECSDDADAGDPYYTTMEPLLRGMGLSYDKLEKKPKQS